MSHESRILHSRIPICIESIQSFLEFTLKVKRLMARWRGQALDPDDEYFFKKISARPKPSGSPETRRRAIEKALLEEGQASEIVGLNMTNFSRGTFPRESSKDQIRGD